MARLIIYTWLITFLLFLVPLPGMVQNSNAVSEAFFLDDHTLAVTFPWKGILIKQGLPQELRSKVIEHEECHIRQIDKHGIIFMVEYYKNPDKFEKECYGE